MARSPQTPDTTKPDTTEAAAQAIASPPVTFDLNDPTLRAMLAQAVAVALAAQKAELMQVMAAGKPATNGKSEKSIRNEIAVVKAFKKAGFGDVKPHVDVKTFNTWMLDDGLRPAEGSKSIRVAHLRLFHRSQCRPVTAEEKAARQQQSDAAVARHVGKVIPINAEANPQ
jgi:hypothetical protein